MDLKRKAAIVTGGGTGVGRATALELARRGCSVLINYRQSREEAQQTAADIAALGVRAIAIEADVRDDAACRRMVATAVRTFERLDVLVNNAAVTRFVRLGDLDAITDQDWQDVFDTNVKGIFQCVRAAKPAMLKSGGGGIVNVSSVAAFRGKGSSIPYCASKAAVNNLTVALASVLAPEIRVNAVAPGFISGRWLKKGLGDKYEKAKQRFEQTMPLGRVCEPEDIAAAILSLLAGSDMVTGQVLVADGGMLISN